VLEAVSCELSDSSNLACMISSSMAMRRKRSAATARRGRTNADERIYRSICDAILERRLPPGTRLQEIELGKLFSVSRTIAHKALLRLAHEGTVSLRPKRVAVVARPSIEETGFVFEARRAVESAVVPLVVRSVTKDRLEALRNQLLRLQADFENARKRWRKEQMELQERASADLLRELLEIFDDFLRALAAAPNGAGAGDLFRQGVEMIAKRMEGFLRSYGIVPIEAVGKPFDPALHEAVAHEVTEVLPESTVLAELRRGYLMNGRVLRTAVVKVAARAAEKGEQSTNRKEA